MPVSAVRFDLAAGTLFDQLSKSEQDMAMGAVREAFESGEPSALDLVEVPGADREATYVVRAGDLRVFARRQNDAVRIVDVARKRHIDAMRRASAMGR